MTEAENSPLPINRDNHNESDTLAHLLGRIALKDQRALQDLYNRTAARLNGIAYRILQNRDLSNEALQEGFLQVWHNAGEYRAHLGEPMAWLTSLVRYRALDKLRSEHSELRRRQQADDFQSLSDELVDPSATDELEANAMNRRLQMCLQELENLHRNAVLMAYYYGYSRDDIAEHLAQPVNTVKSWLKRGLERLSTCLK